MSHYINNRFEIYVSAKILGFIADTFDASTTYEPEIFTHHAGVGQAYQTENGCYSMKIETCHLGEGQGRYVNYNGHYGQQSDYVDERAQFPYGLREAQLQVHVCTG